MNLRRSKIKKELAKISEKILSKTVDLALIGIFFNLEFATYARRKRWMLESKVQEDLEAVNYETLKRAFLFLKQKGLIETIKEENVLPKITEAGKKKLSSLLPHYDEKRVWDGRIYLVTYDLPTKRNKERDYLRNFLKTIGCGLLQQSLWLTPYNPKKLLEEFVEENGLEDNLILISSLGKGGTIGNMTFPELIEQVYRLTELNERYRQILIEFKTLSKEKMKTKLFFKFFSILKEDPQLPFGLLPNNWLGDEAYSQFKKLFPSPI